MTRRLGRVAGEVISCLPEPTLIEPGNHQRLGALAGGKKLPGDLVCGGGGDGIGQRDDSIGCRLSQLNAIGMEQELVGAGWNVMFEVARQILVSRSERFQI